MGLREDLKRWREEHSRLVYERQPTVVHPQVFQQLVDEGVITQQGDLVYHQGEVAERQGSRDVKQRDA